MKIIVHIHNSPKTIYEIAWVEFFSILLYRHCFQTWITKKKALYCPVNVQKDDKEVWVNWIKQYL